MNDLISRETMKDAIDSTTWYHQNRNGVMVEGAHGVEDAWFKAEDVFKTIENVPTAQPNTPTDAPTDAPTDTTTAQRTGRWIFETLDGTPGYRPTVMFCSKCGRVSIANYSYCPNCGARMEGEIE